MKLLTLLLAVFTCNSCVLVRAPLLSRALGDTVENNYIVVLKKGTTAEKAKGYYSFLHTRPQKFGSLKRGIVRMFGNVTGLQAFHVECYEEMLETIRRNPQVRAQNFLWPWAVYRERARLTLPRWIMLPETSALQPKTRPFPTSSTGTQPQRPVSRGV